MPFRLKRSKSQCEHHIQQLKAVVHFISTQINSSYSSLFSNDEKILEKPAWKMAKTVEERLPEFGGSKEEGRGGGEGQEGGGKREGRGEENCSKRIYRYISGGIGEGISKSDSKGCRGGIDTEDCSRTRVGS
jgi:hypothetical protein